MRACPYAALRAGLGAVGNDKTVANGAEPLRSRARYCCALLLRFSALRARIPHATGIPAATAANYARLHPLRSGHVNASIFKTLAAPREKS